MNGWLVKLWQEELDVSVKEALEGLLLLLDLPDY